MSVESDRMLAGELYDPLDPDLVAGRERARDLCQAFKAGKLPNSMTDEKYINVRTVKSLALK